MYDDLGYKDPFSNVSIKSPMYTNKKFSEHQSQQSSDKGSVQKYQQNLYKLQNNILTDEKMRTGNPMLPNINVQQSI